MQTSLPLLDPFINRVLSLKKSRFYQSRKEDRKGVLGVEVRVMPVVPC